MKDEIIIYQADKNWKVTINNKGDVLILTNKRLMCGGMQMLLTDIEKVDIVTQTGPPQIEITQRNDSLIINVQRVTAGHFLRTLIAPEFSVSDIAAYIGYLAALITMAVFHFGNPRPFRGELASQ